MKIIKLIILLITFSFISACTISTNDTGSSLEDNESIDILGDKSSFGDLPSEYSDEENRVEFSSRRDTYQYPLQELVFDVRNNGSKRISYNELDNLEKWIKDGWYRVPYKEGLDTIDIELVAKPEVERAYKILQNEFDYDWTPGTYRLIKSFTITTEKGEEEIFLSAQFEIID